MISHEVKVIGFEERPGDHFTQRPESTRGIIEVKPPIKVGEKFGAMILGPDQHGVTLNEVASTIGSTILIAESQYKPDQALRQEVIKKIAARVAIFADDPSKAMELMQENPFPAPQERY